MREYNDKRMIFVVGNSRSGTTMLGRMLGRNTLVHKFPELHLFGPCRPHGQELTPLTKEECIAAFTWLLDVAERKLHAPRLPEQYREKAILFTTRYFKEGVDSWDMYQAFVFHAVEEIGKQIPCEDLPGNVFKLEQILGKFPEARVIQMVRDPRDVLLSQKNRRNRRKMGATYISTWEVLRFWANYHPIFISRLWNNAVKAGLAVNDPRIITIKFEDLIRDGENTLRKICTHTGITFEPEMLAIPQVGSSTRKDDPNKLGIDSSRSGAWERGGLTNAEIEVSEKINGRLIHQLGYPFSGKKGSFFARLLLSIQLPVKGVMALLLNWNRTKGRWNYILNRFKKSKK
jgi:hypothetical protein